MVIIQAICRIAERCLKTVGGANIPHDEDKLDDWVGINSSADATEDLAEVERGVLERKSADIYPGMCR